MPQPTRQQVHVDAALTNISVAEIQSDDNFIAERVFPTVPVENASDEFFTYDKGYGRRDEVKPRAAGTESAGSGFDIGTDTYKTKVWGFHTDLADQIVANADPALDMEADATIIVTNLFKLQRELAWMNAFFTTGVWATDVTGVAAAPGAGQFLQWNDASSDPEADLDTGKAAMLLATGFEPNTLTVGYQVHQALKRHPLVVDRFKYTTANSITNEMLARFFEVDNYLVSKASYTTSAEGAATATNAMVAGNQALLTYSAPAPGLLTPTAGYSFAWRGFTGASDIGVAISTFRMEHLKADRIEGEFAYQDKVVSADLGYFFASAVA